MSSIVTVSIHFYGGRGNTPNRIEDHLHNEDKNEEDFFT